MKRRDCRRHALWFCVAVTKQVNEGTTIATQAIACQNQACTPITESSRLRSLHLYFFRSLYACFAFSKLLVSCQSKVRLHFN